MPLAVEAELTRGEAEEQCLRRLRRCQRGRGRGGGGVEVKRGTGIALDRGGVAGGAPLRSACAAARVPRGRWQARASGWSRSACPWAGRRARLTRGWRRRAGCGAAGRRGASTSLLHHSVDLSQLHLGETGPKSGGTLGGVLAGLCHSAAPHVYVSPRRPHLSSPPPSRSIPHGVAPASIAPGRTAPSLTV